ncbi:MAG: preprotein translocase subunit YajC [Terriglobales bacterium]
MQNAIMFVALAVQGQGGFGGIAAIAPLILIFAVFYFILILPQQRRQKKWQKMLSELKTGDKVITSGGLRGIVIALRDDFLHLRVPPDNLRIEVARNSVVSVTTGEEVTTTAK